MKGIFQENLNKYFGNKYFAFIGCIFHKEPIELYGFAFYILNVFVPFISLNQTSYSVQFLTKFVA